VTIVAIHVVFFGGLLLQGCKRETKKETGLQTENPQTNALTYGNLPDTNLFYTNTASLPVENTNPPAAAPITNAESSGLTATEPLVTNRLAPPPAPSEPSSPAKEYTVAKGDSFFKIAKANGTTVSALTKANPGVDSAKLKVGQKIKIPAVEASAPKTAAGGDSAAGGAPGVYVVKSGDTLTKVAKTHGVTVSELRAANGLKVSSLKVGQKLKIPEKTERAAGGAPAGSLAQPKQL
jgi:LysM repeat protein